MKEEEEKSCGNCALFSNEDTGGKGLCELHLIECACDEVCEYYSRRSEADSLIKKTNENLNKGIAN